jgi:integrase/recombinase XerC
MKRVERVAMEQQTVEKTKVELDWAGEFETYLREERSAGTVKAYQADLKHFCAWWLRANGSLFEPGLLNTRDLRDYRTSCVEVEQCSPATWNRRRATLRVLCTWCERALGMRPIAFEKCLQAEREQEQAPRWLEAAEERKVMRQVEINVNAAMTSIQRERAIRDLAMVSLMRFAGLRVEEVANLQHGDVTMSERKGDVVVRRGKCDKTRTLPLSASCRAALSDWLAISTYTNEETFFAGVSVRGIQKRVEEIARQTGISDLGCHVLRHTCAKSMVDAGRPLTEVQKILGHEKLETTARYVQPGREDLAEAVEAGELGKLRRGK